MRAVLCDPPTFFDRIVQRTHVPRFRIPATSPRITLVPQVVVPALAALVLLLVLCTVRPELADVVFGAAQRWVTGRFDWFYTLAVTGFLAFLIIVAASRFGDIRLGPDEAEPEFSFVSWTAMLFAAGMGIGLMYFGVGEPMQHYLQPPTASPRRHSPHARPCLPRSSTGAFTPGRFTA